MIQLGIAFLGVSALPYLIYLYGINFGQKHTLSFPPIEALPPISVVISARNEEKNISKRIENLVESNYPNMEIVIVDDASTDSTCDRAWGTLEISHIPYQLTRNHEQMGTSASYNKAIQRATHDIIVATDADTLFKPTALYWIVGRLIDNQSIGAVTGDLQPFHDYNQTTQMESEYRNIYGRMCAWESNHDSTFNFNGALMAFRKSAVGVIDDKKGADDANIAFAVIRNGKRAIYEEAAVVYETIPESFEVQFRQKIRRASGLLNAMWSNKDLLRGDRKFSQFFAVRMWMYFVSPITFFIAILCDPFLFIAATLSLFVPLFRAFILNQFYLLAGLVTINRNVKTWESTSSLEGKK